MSTTKAWSPNVLKRFVVYLVGSLVLFLMILGQSGQGPSEIRGSNLSVGLCILCALGLATAALGFWGSEGMFPHVISRLRMGGLALAATAALPALVVIARDLNREAKPQP